MGLLDFISGQGNTNAAIDAQTQAMQQANATQKQIYDQERTDQTPWREAGAKALGDLQTQMPDLTRSFTMADFQKDPGYDFRMQQGQQALERSAAARGGLDSGGTMKALDRYGQDYASNEYGNAYNRFTNDQSNRFNKLSSLAGVGQTANAQMQQAGENYGNNVSQNFMGMGNAQASAQIGQANREAGLLSGLVQGGVTAGQAYALKASDERLKTNVKPVSSADLAELRKTIKPYLFNYIDDQYGDGDWIGVMAQDLEKSKLGKKLLVERNGFKFVNMDKLMMLLLASMAEG